MNDFTRQIQTCMDSCSPNKGKTKRYANFNNTLHKTETHPWIPAVRDVNMS